MNKKIAIRALLSFLILGMGKSISGASVEKNERDMLAAIKSMLTEVNIVEFGDPESLEKAKQEYANFEEFYKVNKEKFKNFQQKYNQYQNPKIKKKLKDDLKMFESFMANDVNNILTMILNSESKAKDFYKNQAKKVMDLYKKTEKTWISELLTGTW